MKISVVVPFEIHRAVAALGHNGAFVIYDVNSSARSAELKLIGHDFALSSIPWRALTFLDELDSSQTYWLHIIEHKSPQTGAPSIYTLARANAPRRNFTGGAMPMVHHHSWERLSALLSRVGIDDGVLRDTKTGLDRTGSHTITEVILPTTNLNCSAMRTSLLPKRPPRRPPRAEGTIVYG